MKALKTWISSAAGAALFALAAHAQVGNPGGSINDNLGDVNYGVCRGVDPKCFHDWPRRPVKQYRILLFTRTGAVRHGNLGPSLSPGVNPPLDAKNAVHLGMLRLAEKNGWHLDYTEDLAAMGKVRGLTPDAGAIGQSLDTYNAIVFFSTSREALNDTAKTALQHYMRGGGGFMAIHAAFASLYQWPYFEGLLGGAHFYSHLALRSGDVVTIDRQDTSTKDLPPRWKFRDEWYNLVPFPTRVRFLATVDESSWPVETPTEKSKATVDTAEMPYVLGRMPGHGSFHPVAWCQYYDGGRVWATTIGHDSDIFAGDNAVYPGSVEFEKMIVGGLKSVMGIEPFCR